MQAAYASGQKAEVVVDKSHKGRDSSIVGYAMQRRIVVKECRRLGNEWQQPYVPMYNSRLNFNARSNMYVYHALHYLLPRLLTKFL